MRTISGALKPDLLTDRFKAAIFIMDSPKATPPANPNK